MLRREEQRLRRAFGALLLALVPAAAEGACGSGDIARPGADAGEAEGPLDATVEGADADAGAADDGSSLVDHTATDAGSDADATKSCGAIVNVIPPAPDAAPDADLGCAIDLPCGLPEHIFAVGCELYHQEPDDGGATDIFCRLVEDAGCTNDAASLVDGGFVSTVCLDCPGGAGRATAGVAAPRRVWAHDRTGAYFARMAHGEAASVVAFERLARELADHGAPSSLVRAARRAARDEVRHARAMRALAAARGAKAPRVRSEAARRARTRPLVTLAAENAAEGCVRETFGALLLAHQARAAGAEPLRRTFARIAEDETRHAALAWALARWADEALDDAGRTRVARARARAVCALRRELAARPRAPHDRLLGLPDRAAASALLDGMCRALGLAA